MDRFRTIIEPFPIHSVEPIRMSDRMERQAHLAQAGHNLFALRSKDVLVDLLTDKIMFCAYTRYSAADDIVMSSLKHDLAKKRRS